MLSYFGKILIYGQFAENQIQLGFSETTRESFQYINGNTNIPSGVYSQYENPELAEVFQGGAGEPRENPNFAQSLFTHKRTLHSVRGFLYWFIGFTEGDGSFIVNKTGYLEFKVTQSTVDCQILFYIKNI